MRPGLLQRKGVQGQVTAAGLGSNRASHSGQEWEEGEDTDARAGLSMPAGNPCIPADAPGS